MMCVLVRDTRARGHRGGGPVQTEAETGVVPQQAMPRLESPEIGRGQTIFSLRDSKESTALPKT